MTVQSAPDLERTFTSRTCDLRAAISTPFGGCSLLTRRLPSWNTCSLASFSLDSSAFKPSKSQRSILNRFNTFIEEGGREGQLGYGPARAAPSQPRAVHGKVKGKASKNAIFDLTEVLHRAEGKRDAAHLFEVSRVAPPQTFTQMHHLRSHQVLPPQVSMEAATFTEEKFELYKKYQVQIHGDKASDLKERSFRRFLCDSPLSVSRTWPVCIAPSNPFADPWGWLFDRWRHLRWPLSRTAAFIRCTGSMASLSPSVLSIFFLERYQASTWSMTPTGRLFPWAR